jgi:hypothetical protein
MKLIALLFYALSFSLFAQEKVAYQELIEKLVHQKAVIDFYVQVSKDSYESQRPLTGYELNEISVTSAERFRLRREALTYVENSRDLVKRRIKKESKFTISDEEIKEVVESLAVAVTLFDTTLYSHITIQNDKRLRRILGERDQAYDREGNEHKLSILSLFSMKNRKHLKRAIKIYEDYFLGNEEIFNVPELAYAHRAIQSSYYYTNFRNDSKMTQLNEIFNVLEGKISLSVKSQADFLAWLGNSIFYQGSRIFGNVVGGFQKRRGLLYQDERFLADVERELQPLDVLLEKTPHRLTDRFIPGYWGHAAIYLGSIEHLKALGIWDHPLVEKRKRDLVKGKLIVEALRNKVQLNTLEHFSDIDDFALLRLREPLSADEQREHILRTLSHLDKRYDFNFDVETGKTIVCSEIHYRVFINVPFKTTRILGRSTISVDQVAQEGMQDRQFEPVLLYVNGEKIEQNVQQIFESLLIQENIREPSHSVMRNEEDAAMIMN